MDKFSKVEGTQLYFKFQPLRPIVDTVVNPFNLVVRTNYRKNEQDYTIILRNNVDDQRSDLPFVPHLQYSQWIPENGVNAVCESVVQPCPLVEKSVLGSRFSKQFLLGSQNQLSLNHGSTVTMHFSAR